MYILNSLIAFLFPTKTVRPILNWFGWGVQREVRIGFTLILANKVALSKGVRIGSCNILNVNSLKCGSGAIIGSFNRCKGMLDIVLDDSAAIGNFNIIVRASQLVKKGVSKLHLGNNSKITSRHYIDCLGNILFHEGVVLAGCGSQVWTHGYFHYPNSLKRFRVDGDVEVGAYCYIGSRSIINPGVKICSGVSLGTNSCVSKSIDAPGYYVNQPLRLIRRNSDSVISGLKRGGGGESIEEFYVKELE